MKQTSSGFLLALIAVCLAAGALADSRIEVEGLLVVTECRGADYQQISSNRSNRSTIEAAAGCARMGAPIAVLANGRLYTLVSPSRPLAAYIAKDARLRGEEIAPGVVIPEKLEIRTGNGWIEVATTSLM